MDDTPSPKLIEPHHVTPPPTSPETSRQERRSSFSLWRLVIGLVVVFFGLQLLGQNYGWSWATNFDLGQLWPVFIILIGISMLSRGHAINSAVGAVLTLMVIAFVATLVIAKPSAVKRNEVHRDISIAKVTSATSTRLALDMGAASVTIRGGSTQAASGTFASTVADLTSSSEMDGTTQRITLSTKNNTTTGWVWFQNMRNTIDLQLSDTIPTELTVDSGAASLDLDLHTVPTPRVTIDAGASSINLKLSDKSDANTTVIKSGASSIDITVPKTVDGVRVKLDAGLSGKTLPSDLKDRGAGVYETDSYATAKKKVDLSIDAGVSSITLHWQ